jgi:DNA-binding transcriptional LysR family regulator
MIDLKHFRYFVAVAETLNFGQAAQVLNLRQPTLSQQISKLEERLGVWLLERLPGRVQLTAAGAKFLRDCRRVLFEYDRTVEYVTRAGRAEVGQISIGVFVSLAAGRQRELLTEFMRLLPEIEVEFVEGGRADQLTRLRDRRLDVAFVAGGVEFVGLDYTHGWSESLYAVLPEKHPLASAERIDWAALRRERIIVRGSDKSGEIFDFVIPKLLDHAESRNITPHLVGRGTLLNLFGMGQGITVVAEAATGLAFPGAVFRRIDDADATLNIGFAWHPQNANPVLRRFIALTDQMKTRWRKGAQ